MTGFLFASFVMSGVQPSDVGADDKIEPAKVELGRPVDFTRDIYPILAKNCVSCHNVSVKEGEFVAENVISMLAGGDSGPAIVAEKPDESLLYLYATRSEEPCMPPLPNQVGARALSAEEIGLIRQWIVEGAQPGSKSQQPSPAWRSVPAHIKSIHAVALSPWNRFAVWGRANQIYVYDLLTGQEPQRLIDPHLTAMEVDEHALYPGGAAHRDLVHSLALSPDGTLLASGGYRVVKLWQRAPNTRTSDWSLSSGVSALAVSDDGKWLAAGTTGNQIELWDMLTGKQVATLAGHTGVVSGVQFTRDGQRLYSCSLDQSIRCWECPSGNGSGLLQTDAAVNGLVLNQDATRLVSAHADNRIRVWDASVAGAPDDGSGNGHATLLTPLLEISGHTQPVTAVALVMREVPTIISGSEDATVRLWDMDHGQQLLSLDAGGPVSALAVRPDNQAVAAASLNGTARLWDLTGKQLTELRGTLRGRRQVARLQMDQIVAGQRLAHARNALATAEKELAAIEAALTKAQEVKSTSDAALVEAKNKSEQAADLLAAAKEALSKNAGDANLQQKASEAEAEATKRTAALDVASTANQSAQQAVEIADGSLTKGQETLAAANLQLSQRQQEQKTTDEDLQSALAQAAQTPPPMLALAFSPDGSQLVTAGTDQLVHIWNPTTGEPIETFAGHEGPIGALSLSQAGTLVSGSSDHRVVVWDRNPPWQLVGQLGPPAEDPLNTSESPFVGRVLALDFSRDGKLLATGGGEASRRGELMLWDVETRSRVRELVDAHSDTVFGVEFSGDDKYLLSCAADKLVKIFEVGSGRELRSFEGHTHHVLDVSWKADGNAMVSAGADNVIKYWNIETGEQIQTMGGYAKQVTSVQCVGTGDDIVSCSGDTSVRLHTASDGKNHRNFAGGTDYMYAVTAANDLAIILAGGEDGILRLWNGKDGSLLKALDPPTPQEEPAGGNSR